MDKHDITIYNTYINVDLERYEMFHAKVEKDGIKDYFINNIDLSKG